MAKKTGRAQLRLSEEDRKTLLGLSGSRTAAIREVKRAKILLAYAEGSSFAEIARQVGTYKRAVTHCIDRALAAGVKVALKDRYHRPKAPVITEEAKQWVVNVACTKPKDQGLAAELWSISALAMYVRAHAAQAGYACLLRAAKATVWRILSAHSIKPHRIRYYLERRDEDFDKKMEEVLMVYREVALQNIDTDSFEACEVTHPVYSVSVDEKPGVQAIENTAPDLPPVPGKQPCIARDHEYKRHGTVSILAALDLHTGHVIANVEERHRSCEFIKLLERLDAYYPKESTIRVVLDNHSAHISKETMAWLAQHPGRFEYVHTPKHGSWLNLIECAFSKMARTFLRAIRVSSKEELKQRILNGIDEMNHSPVVFRWTKHDLEIN